MAKDPFICQCWRIPARTTRGARGWSHTSGGSTSTDSVTSALPAPRSDAPLLSSAAALARSAARSLAIVGLGVGVGLGASVVAVGVGAAFTGWLLCEHPAIAIRVTAPNVQNVIRLMAAPVVSAGSPLFRPD